MTYPAFPATALDPNVLAWSVHVSPKFVTNEIRVASGRSTRRMQYATAIYDLDLTYEILKSAAASDALQTIMGFFAAQKGQATPFWIPLPGLSSVTGQALGIGDGATTTFPFVRNFGSYSEPVNGVSFVGNVYLNGSPVGAGAVTVNPAYPPTLTFLTAPGSGVAITADFNQLWLARFSGDVEDFQENYAMLWELKTLKIETTRPSNGDTPPGPNPIPIPGPGDIVPTDLIFFYSLRGVNAEYDSGGQLAIRVRRGSDNAELDLTILISGGLDLGTAALFGAGTDLFVVTWYDQSGNGHHATQPTASQQPQLLFNQTNGLPGVAFVSANQTLLQDFAATTDDNQPFSFSFIAEGTSSTQTAVYGNAEYLLPASEGVQIILSDSAAGVYSNGLSGSGTVTGSASSGQVHAVQAVLNGASSVVNIDGTETTGSGGGGALFDFPAIVAIGAFVATSGAEETIYWDGTLYEIGGWSLAFTSAQRSDLHTNDSGYYGTP